MGRGSRRGLLVAACVLPLLWVVLGEGRSDACLDVNVIRRPIRRAMPALRTCYQGYLRRKPNRSAKLVVKFRVRRGRADRIRFSDDSAMDRRLRKCVATVFRGLQFPPTIGGTIHVSYPLRFVPAKPRKSRKSR
jgi:hypothetical protein